MKKITILITLCLWLLFPHPTLADESVRLITIFPSDPTAFTQGLTLDSSRRLVQSTGLYGQSVIGINDLESGKLEVMTDLPEEYFGEGISFTDQYLWQLTWRENRAFCRDPQSFEIIKEVPYDGEGWGITYSPNDHILWMSDGSSDLQKRDPETFELLERVPVTYQGKAVENLNELEYAHGLIYANVWQTNQIVAISESSGEIEAVFDLTDIVEDPNLMSATHQKRDVLNGIAHIQDQEFYLTGKNFAYVYHVELIK